MMKFFRKYNKQLLAVFMALLMIVFLGGSALEGMLNPSMNQVVAKSNLGEITLYDQREASQTTRLLEMAGINWRQPVGGANKPLQEVDWILLLREADKLGTRVDIATVRNSYPAEELDRIARVFQVRPDRILSAIADYRSVQQTASAVGSAAHPSEAAITAAARQALEKVRINAVLLPASAFVDETYQPTEEEIQAQFDKYREVEAGEGLNFGYYRQPEVKVEYIKIDPAVLAEQITVPNLRPRAEEYFEENRSTDPAFRRPPEEIYPTEGLVGPPQDPFLSWDEAEPIAEEAIREEHAATQAEQTANRILQYTAESWFDAERGEDGYKKAPESATRPDYYAELIEQLVRYPQAVSVGTTDFFTLDEAGDVPGLGGAMFRASRGGMQTFATLIGRTKAFVPEVPEQDALRTGEYLAPYQSCPFPVKDFESGTVYIFRPVDSRPGRAAESVDEVRDEIVEDLRLLHAFEAAKARAESLRSCAAVDPELTLKEAYESDWDLVDLAESPEGAGAGYLEPEPFARVPRYQAGRGRPENGVYVGGLGQLPNDVVDACFALEKSFEKTKILELPGRAAVLVVEWVETLPPDVDEFNTLRDQLASQLPNTKRYETMTAWLNPDNIQARHGFELVTR